MTTYTTRITASITAAAIEQAHDYMLTLASPAGTRFFGTEPNRTGANGDYLIVETVAHPTVADAYRQCADEIAGVSLTPSVSPYADQTFPPLPDTGEPVEAGQIYDDGEALWMARQSHDRTTHSPADVLALFTRYRSATDGADWIAAESVDAGDVRHYDGETYRAIQAHTAQEGWEPSASPALWALLERPKVPDDTSGDTTPQWEPGLSVAVEEVYAYDGAEYSVLQAHTTQAGWEPPNVPALWAVVVNVNTASASELQTLGGVGPTLASRIIDGRTYASVDDLTRVDGVSQSMVDGWVVTV